MNSRAKGVRGELELRNKLREYGYEAERGQQHAGGGDSPDVIHNIPGIHAEAKWVDRGINPYNWMAQAKRDSAGTENIPVVFHKQDGRKKDRGDILVILRADDFLKMCRRLDYAL